MKAIMDASAQAARRIEHLCGCIDDMIGRAQLAMAAEFAMDAAEAYPQAAEMFMETAVEIEEISRHGHLLTPSPRARTFELLDW